ncbi:hypothetical protein ACIA6C_28145 [Streptomyces sp. NPDC051578]|uniref:hypothetical protein n=1 Tax=Streptomyces sp. NPDC051578 TaxID=3365662 RepID=UPI0037B3B263
MNADEALGHAVRLLVQAELELTNLPLMERLDELANSWLSLGAILTERERT